MRIIKILATLAVACGVGHVATASAKSWRTVACEAYFAGTGPVDRSGEPVPYQIIFIDPSQFREGDYKVSLTVPTHPFLWEVPPDNEVVASIVFFDLLDANGHVVWRDTASIGKVQPIGSDPARTRPYEFQVFVPQKLITHTTFKAYAYGSTEGCYAARIKNFD